MQTRRRVVEVEGALLVLPVVVVNQLRLLEVERFSHNTGLSGHGIQRVVQTPTVTDDGETLWDL